MGSGRCSRGRFRQSSSMAIGQPVSSRVSLTVAAVACVSFGACENATVPTRHPVSSEECGLAAEALERLISWERPLTHPWHLDFDAPPTFWERDAFIHPATLEQAGAQERYIWLVQVPEAPSKRSGAKACRVDETRTVRRNADDQLGSSPKGRRCKGLQRGKADVSSGTCSIAET